MQMGCMRQGGHGSCVADENSPDESMGTMPQPGADTDHKEAMLLGIHPHYHRPEMLTWVMACMSDERAA